MAPDVKKGCDLKTARHLAARRRPCRSRSGRSPGGRSAAVVPRNLLEVVVDRQLGQADLLDLGRRHQVDAGQAAQEGHRRAVPVQRAAVERVLLLDHPLDPVGLARQPLLLLLELVDVAAAASPSRPSWPCSFAWRCFEFLGAGRPALARPGRPRSSGRPAPGVPRPDRSCRRRGCACCRARSS